MVKLIQKRPLESYRNAFANLALPLVTKRNEPDTDRDRNTETDQYENNGERWRDIRRKRMGNREQEVTHFLYLPLRSVSVSRWLLLG